MILSITYAIDPAIEKEWVAFAKDEHVPALQKAFDFEHVRLTKVIPEESMDTSFNLQLQFPNEDLIDEFLKNEGGTIHGALLKQFDGKMAMFTLRLKEII